MAQSELFGLAGWLLAVGLLVWGQTGAQAGHAEAGREDAKLRGRLGELLQDQELADDIVEYAGLVRVQPADQRSLERILASSKRARPAALASNSSGAPTMSSLLRTVVYGDVVTCDGCPHDCRREARTCLRDCQARACEVKCRGCHPEPGCTQSAHCDTCNCPLPGARRGALRRASQRQAGYGQSQGQSHGQSHGQSQGQGQQQAAYHQAQQQAAYHQAQQQAAYSQAQQQAAYSQAQSMAGGRIDPAMLAMAQQSSSFLEFAVKSLLPEVGQYLQVLMQGLSSPQQGGGLEASMASSMGMGGQSGRRSWSGRRVGAQRIFAGIFKKIIEALVKERCHCHLCEPCRCGADVVCESAHCDRCIQPSLECPCGGTACQCGPANVTTSAPERAPSSDSSPAAAASTARPTPEPRCDGWSCPWRDSCGSAPLNTVSGLHPKVFGGKPERYGNWPQFARLKIVRNSNSICGGVLVSNKHVLTAAHCVYLDSNKGRPKAVRAKDVTVFLSEHSVNRKDSHELEVATKSVCIASKYEEAVDTLYDFAVIELVRPVNFSDYRQPACLPRADLDYSDKRCYVMGLGVVETGPFGHDKMADVVQELQVEKVDCRPAWTIAPNDSSRHCFAHVASSGDSCSGDSGGPVLCAQWDDVDWTVAGLVSYGSAKCDGTEEPGWKAVYTDVRKLLPEMSRDCGL